MRIGINKFVHRQTPESRFSHFEGTFDELAALVDENFDNQEPGYRDGVILVSVPAALFRSGVVEITEDTPLSARLTRRRKDEAPYIEVTAAGPKLPATSVQIVLYRADVLQENNDNSTDAEWEVISINAKATEGPEPMNPVAMARNFLQLEGGTKAEYTAEEFAQAIIYWSTKAMASG